MSRQITTHQLKSDLEKLGGTFKNFQNAASSRVPKTKGAPRNSSADVVPSSSQREGVSDLHGPGSPAMRPATQLLQSDTSPQPQAATRLIVPPLSLGQPVSSPAAMPNLTPGGAAAESHTPLKVLPSDLAALTAWLPQLAVDEGSGVPAVSVLPETVHGYRLGIASVTNRTAAEQHDDELLASPSGMDIMSSAADLFMLPQAPVVTSRAVRTGSSGSDSSVGAAFLVGKSTGRRAAAAFPPGSAEVPSGRLAPAAATPLLSSSATIERTASGLAAVSQTQAHQSVAGGEARPNVLALLGIEPIMPFSPQADTSPFGSEAALDDDNAVRGLLTIVESRKHQQQQSHSEHDFSSVPLPLLHDGAPDVAAIPGKSHKLQQQAGKLQGKDREAARWEQEERASSTGMPLGVRPARRISGSGGRAPLPSSSRASDRPTKYSGLVKRQDGAAAASQQTGAPGRQGSVPTADTFSAYSTPQRPGSWSGRPNGPRTGRHGGAAAGRPLEQQQQASVAATGHIGGKKDAKKTSQFATPPSSFPIRSRSSVPGVPCVSSPASTPSSLSSAKRLKAASLSGASGRSPVGNEEMHLRELKVESVILKLQQQSECRAQEVASLRIEKKELATQVHSLQRQREAQEDELSRIKARAAKMDLEVKELRLLLVAHRTKDKMARDAHGKLEKSRRMMEAAISQLAAADS